MAPIITVSETDVDVDVNDDLDIDEYQRQVDAEDNNKIDERDSGTMMNDQDIRENTKESSIQTGTGLACKNRNPFIAQRAQMVFELWFSISVSVSRPTYICLEENEQLIIIIHKS